MPGPTFWRSAPIRLAGKLAWKDLSARRGRSALLLLALAVSISGVSGVRGAVSVGLEALHRGSRAPLGGDVCVDTGEVITEEQYAGLDDLRKDGIQWTLVTLMLTMASSSESPDAAFVSVKAVDPDVYPFYGDARMAADLRGDGVMVSENTLRRLNVSVGDPIHIAGMKFHITAVGKAEPEQILGILTSGNRCTLSHENYRKSGIARGGNASRNRILLRLPPGFDVLAAKQKLRELIPEGIVLDYRDVNQNIGLQIENVTVFLNETGLLALALGSMGMAIAVRQHLEQRIEIFALMKLVGARNGQLVSIFLVETALLIAAALPLGAALGWLLKTALLSLAANFFVVPAVSGGIGVLFLEGAGAAILAMIPAVAEPVWMLCRLRPAPFLRNESPHIDRPGRALVWTSAALLIAAFVVIAHQVLISWNGAILFSGALLLGALLSYGLAKFSLFAIGIMRPRRAAMRLGLGNLTRPGNQAALLIAVISAGTMMMVATLESAAVTMRAVRAWLPYDLTSSLLIAGFQDAYRERVVSFASSLPGVEKVEMRTQAGLRLTAVNGVSMNQVGPWYIAGCSAQGRLTIDRDVARSTGATTGSGLEFVLGDRVISANVASIVDERGSYPVMIDCEDLEGTGLFHQALVHAVPGRLLEVDQAIRARFPGLAVITPSEIDRVVSDISRDSRDLGKIVAGFSVAAGLCILMTLVAASRSRRLRETGVLSALGATPKVLAWIYTIEFAVIGAIAGIIGSAAACGFASMLLAIIFQRWEIAFGWWMAAGAVLTSALLTTAAGWLPTYSLLRQKPMNVLRGI
jgi:putative ABC transport system permease protein